MEISDKTFEKWKKKLVGPRWIYHGDVANVDFIDETTTMVIKDKRTSEEYVITGDKALKTEEIIIFKETRRDDKEKFVKGLIDKISTKDQLEAIRIAENIIESESKNEATEEPIESEEVNTGE